MKTYVDLMTEFNRKVAWLQKHCKHEETEVLPYMWAPGHFLGSHKVCKCCSKIIQILPDPVLASWTIGPASLWSTVEWKHETKES